MHLAVIIFVTISITSSTEATNESLVQDCEVGEHLPCPYFHNYVKLPAGKHVAEIELGDGSEMKHYQGLYITKKEHYSRNCSYGVFLFHRETVCQQGNITAFLPFGQNTTIVTLIGGETEELSLGEFQMTFEYELEQICSYYVFVRESIAKVIFRAEYDAQCDLVPKAMLEATLLARRTQLQHYCTDDCRVAAEDADYYCNGSSLFLYWPVQIVNHQKSTEDVVSELTSKLPLALDLKALEIYSNQQSNHIIAAKKNSEGEYLSIGVALTCPGGKMIFNAVESCPE
ncbi:hypothetical protein EB796_018210 [Bugula neritina]|uniref:Uncharacterized protein n=1 Tax=Bugula neritina TaxID=10212 RepID=A0A7J7JDM4_BUGNE|nr:hypothetical protein EB796_018210 [Bugula neritina]